MHKAIVYLLTFRPTCKHRTTKEFNKVYSVLFMSLGPWISFEIGPGVFFAVLFTLVNFGSPNRTTVKKYPRAQQWDRRAGLLSQTNPVKSFKWRKYLSMKFLFSLDFWDRLDGNCVFLKCRICQSNNDTLGH